MGSVIASVHESALILRMLVKVLAWIRLVQVLLWPLAFTLGVRYSPPHLPLALLGYGLQAVWALAYGGRALRMGTLPDWLMALDITVTCSCLVISGLGWSTASGSMMAGLAVYPAAGVALATGVVWWRGRAVAAAALIAVCYVLGVLPQLHRGAPTMVTVTGNVLLLFSFTVVAGLITRRLLGQAAAVAEATAAMLSARELAAAERARDEERMIQYRLLHDTVLSTLSIIARGDVEVPAQLRQRCAAEADALRSMISGDARPVTPLIAELALLIRHQAALGLHVHGNIGELPQELPREAAAALIGSCREALNNVAKHAGTDQAWLTAWTGQDGSVVISVADRGRGFDPEFIDGGMGMSQSIVARMAEAGGTGKVDSSPGQGTCVELRWPR
jgi:signal transduction histidine kinase